VSAALVPVLERRRLCVVVCGRAHQRVSVTRVMSLCCMRLRVPMLPCVPGRRFIAAKPGYTYDTVLEVEYPIFLILSRKAR
jgi:hypothetical protein